jgi:hypothetical protein
MFYQVVSQRDGVPERLHRQCFISETGDVEKMYHATQSEDNVVVFQRMSVAVKTVRDDGTTLRQVDRLNLALKEPNVPQHLTDRIDDMRDIEVTCRYFMKHRREQEEVFLTNQRDFEIGIAALFELKRRI